MNIDEVLRWLEHTDEDLTLVGGQAVALWEHLLGLPILTETLDIDFLGDPAQAEALAEMLNYRCRIPEPSDPTPNTAVILDDNNQVVADFLGMVAGLNETDILRRRVPVELAGGHAVQVRDRGRLEDAVPGQGEWAVVGSDRLSVGALPL